MTQRPEPPAGAAAGLALVAGAAVLWGTVGVASKALYGVVDISPLVVGFFRLALSVPLLLALSLYAFGRRTFAFRGRDLPLVLGLGASIALYQVFYFTAVATAGVAIATLVTICTAPLFVVVLAVGLLGERITGRVVLALAVGLAGTVLLVGFPGDGGRAGADIWTGAAWALGSAFSYAVFTLCSRALAPRHHPFPLIAVGFGTGALILLPVAAAAGLTWSYPPAGWGFLLYIGLVPTAFAYVVYFRGMRTTPATVASIATLMEPLAATLLAWLLFGERLGLLGGVGGVLLLASIILLTGRQRNSTSAACIRFEKE